MRSVNRENGMIVKFHARGKGGGSGPVDYLLGRERNQGRGESSGGCSRKRCGNSSMPAPFAEKIHLGGSVFCRADPATGRA